MRLAHVIAVCSIVGSMAACQRDTDPVVDAGVVEEAMVEQYGASASEAACVASYVVEEYSVEEGRTIVADGIAALPLSRWEPFLSTAVACFNPGGGPAR